MNTQVAMVRRAVQAEIYTEWHRGPGWILGSTVKAYLHAFSHVNHSEAQGAYLVRWFYLQFLEDLLRLGFRCRAHIVGEDASVVR